MEGRAKTAAKAIAPAGARAVTPNRYPTTILILAERTTRQTFVNAFIPVQTGGVLRCPPLPPVSITHPPPDVS